MAGFSPAAIRRGRKWQQQREAKSVQTQRPQERRPEEDRGAAQRIPAELLAEDSAVRELPDEDGEADAAERS